MQHGAPRAAEEKETDTHPLRNTQTTLYPPFCTTGSLIRYGGEGVESSVGGRKRWEIGDSFLLCTIIARSWRGVVVCRVRVRLLVFGNIESSYFPL